MKLPALLLLLAALAVTAPAAAQTAATSGATAQAGTAYPASPSGPPARKVLTQADLDRFVRDWPRLAEELEAIGAEYDADDGDFDPSGAAGMAAAFRANARAQAVLARYGWKEGFWDTWAAILTAFGAIGLEDAFKEAGMALPPEYLATMKASVHPDDLALVRRNRAAVERALDEAD